jgi:hypothetical protein
MSALEKKLFEEKHFEFIMGPGRSPLPLPWVQVPKKVKKL